MTLLGADTVTARKEGEGIPADDITLEIELGLELERGQLPRPGEAIILS